MSGKIYWIHLKEHTDNKTQGYVGLTQDLRRRLIEHKRYLRKNPNTTTHFYQAVKKYGWDNLITDEIDTYTTDEEGYIKEFNLRPTENIGWNTKVGGQSVPSKCSVAREKLRGRKHTEETKRLISRNNSIRELTEGGKKNVADSMRRVTLEYSVRDWEIITPEGEVLVITNLNQWCRDNNIPDKFLRRVASGTRSHYKGYRCKRITNSC